MKRLTIWEIVANSIRMRNLMWFKYYDNVLTDTSKIAEAMAGGAEDCLCVTKNGKKKCDGNKCRSE